MQPQWLDEVKFNADGLVTVVAQDKESGRVLMLAWADREALEESVRTGRGAYFSRSRQKLWRKGEESGNAVLYTVTQIGNMACHTGRQSCFYRRLEDGAWRITDDVIVDPAQLYTHH